MFHRNAKALPTDPKEIKDRVEWIFEHPLWSYPVTFPATSKADHKIFREFAGTTHRCGGGFYDSVSFMYVYVSPETERIEDDKSKNTAFRVWIEAGGWHDQSQDENATPPKDGWTRHNKWIGCHDTRLDCGAPDAETALLELAALVEFFYDEEGNERKEAPKECEVLHRETSDGEVLWTSQCIEDEEGFCKNCGFNIGWHK